MCQGLICQLIFGMLAIIVSLGDTPGVGTATLPVAEFAISSEAVVSNQYNLWFTTGDQAADRIAKATAGRHFGASDLIGLTN